MTWFRVDDGFTTHPKARAIPRAQRLRVWGLWMACGVWSARHLTDGVVPADVVLDEGGKPGEALLLVNAGLWHVAGHTCATCAPVPADSYLFHEWSPIQPTRASVLADRAAAAERQRRAREKAKAEREAKAKSQRDSRRESLDNSRENHTGSHGPPDPTRPDLSSSASTKRAQAPPPESPHAGDVVAAWVEACEANDVKPSSGQRSQVGRLAKELLAAGNDPARVLAAARAAAAKGYATIDRELTAMAGRQSGGGPTGEPVGRFGVPESELPVFWREENDVSAMKARGEL